MADCSIYTNWDSSISGWAVTGGSGDTTLQWQDTGGNPNGCLYSRIYGRNKSADPHWYWIGTWENLGVPSGATVTAVQLLGLDWQCSVYNVGANTTQIRATLLTDSAGTTTIATLAADQDVVTGTTAWATISGTEQSIGSSYQASNTVIQLIHDLYLRNGNNAAAEVVINSDNFYLKITYSVASGQKIYVYDGASFEQVVPKVYNGASWNTVVVKVYTGAEWKTI